MRPEDLAERNLGEEFIFTTSRSSGPGGQNVNKVNTKVELRFNVLKSQRLSDSEKNVIAEKLRNRINNDGELLIVSQSERSQLKNKKNAIEKFYAILSKILIVKTVRIPTKPTVNSKERRLEGKKRRSVIKRTRNDSEASQVE